MKIRVVSNYHVVVWPDFIFEKHEYQAALNLEKEIKRHVDMKSIEVMWDDELRCGLCGNTWEEDQTGCPLCCNAAVAEWEKEHPPTQSTPPAKGE